MRSVNDSLRSGHSSYHEREMLVTVLSCIEVNMVGFKARLGDLHGRGWRIAYDKDMLRMAIHFSCRHEESRLAFDFVMDEYVVRQMTRHGGVFPVGIPMLKPEPVEVERDYTVLELLEKAEAKLERQL